MKKNASKFTVLSGALALVSILLFSGCERKGKDDPGKQDLIPQLVDDIDFIQSSIAPINSDGSLKCHLLGAPLDEADSTVVSVETGDMSQTVALVSSILLEPERLTAGDKGVYTYELRHSDGQAYGVATLRPVEDDNVFAVFSVTPSNALRYVSEIHFLKKWPENGSSPYSIGETRVRDNIKFVCIREASKGISGIFVGVQYSDVSDSLFSVWANRDRMAPASYIPSLAEMNVIASCMDVQKSADSFSNEIASLNGNYFYQVKEVNNDTNAEATLVGLYNLKSKKSVAKSALFPGLAAADAKQQYIKGSVLTYRTFQDGAVHGTGMESSDPDLEFGGSTNDNGIINADAPIR